jgi:hypothetical protein
MIQFTLDNLLDKVTLHDLVSSEKESGDVLLGILTQSVSLK